MIDNLSAYPSYYAHMGPANTAGPGPAHLDVPQPVNTEELSARLEHGEWVIDLRNRIAFARDHLHGSASFEYGDGSNFTTFLGWVLPWDRKLTLVGDRDDVENAIRDLSRIGIDQPDIALGTDPAALAPNAARNSYPSVSWDEVHSDRSEQEDVIVDVRRTDEYDTQHIEGAVNVPLHELLHRMDDLPNRKLWVHCGSGYRASVAASLLQRAGKDVVHIDGMFDDAEKAALPMSR